MKPVTIYMSATCPFCQRAMSLLDSKGVNYQAVSVDGRPDVRQKMTQKAGQSSVPQIWIGDTHVGGCDDLFALESADKLNDLLA
ncbi:glutaredoxin 3 [Endozoicomonas gorgoniicola]|uniref:Glutaredoxin n=1 Tax=Endozoicomonas gorgoniicola TaxID=1234144 RepID=A0ABT3N3Q2_9GAMM|nr:glutaredoxin 3 [Endozoicomonas gorgoniicola]MCW7556262.1 glutaredoxin 3 [Endozoicomonas gorgoniicola]